MSLWVDALGASVTYYDAGGVRTRALEAGDGETVLFLHGIGGHVEAFIKNIVPLSDRYRAVAIDMIGHGLTGKPDGDYLIPDYVRHLGDVLDALKCEKAHIVGESLGGWVAFWYAREHPERVASYISCVGSGLKVDDFELLQSAGVNALRQRSVAAAAAPTRESIRQRLAWLFHDPDRFVSEELVDTRLFFWSQPDMIRVQPSMMNLLDPELGSRYYITPEHLQAFRVPSYFLWTEFNPTIPWQTAKRAAELVPGARFDCIPGCGHWPQYEDPDTFHSLLRSWLTSVPVAAKA